MTDGTLCTNAWELRLTLEVWALPTGQGFPPAVRAVLGAEDAEQRPQAPLTPRKSQQPKLSPGLMEGPLEAETPLTETHHCRRNTDITELFGDNPTPQKTGMGKGGAGMGMGENGKTLIMVEAERWFMGFIFLSTFVSI